MLSYNKKIIRLFKKPLPQIIAGGFLIFLSFILIWWILGAEIKESRVINISDIINTSSVEHNIVDNKIIVDVVYRDEYLIVKLKEKTNDLFKNKSKRFLYGPFLGNYEKRIVDSSLDKHNGVFMENINISKLLSVYTKLSGNHFLSFLNSENLKNHLYKNHEKIILSVLDGVAVIDIGLSDNNRYYFGKIKDLDNIDEKFIEFEDIVTSILGAMLPTERGVLLPDKTSVMEIVSSKKDFNFNDIKVNGKNLRYIKEDRLNFSFAYNIDGNTVFFSDKIDLGGKSFFYSKNNNDSDEFLAVMPIGFLSKLGIDIESLDMDIEKYDKVIFKESKKFNEIWIIFK